MYQHSAVFMEKALGWFIWAVHQAVPSYAQAPAEAHLAHGVQVRYRAVHWFAGIREQIGSA
jgi:hypothetical protein